MMMARQRQQQQQSSDASGDDTTTTMAWGERNRKNRLLGLGLKSRSIAGRMVSACSDFEDSTELSEQDLWDAETRRCEEEEEEEEEEDEEIRKNGVWFMKNRPDGSDSRKHFTNGRRWFSVDKDPHGDVIFSRGLSSLSPFNRNQGSSSREGSAARIQTPSRLIHQVGSHSDPATRQIMQQSAPVNIADWSKLTGGTPRLRMDRNLPDSVAEDEDDEDDERLPPHELLAREYAKSQITTSSVFEGVGRTLKGRDLSRVRNAVLRQTGFLDS